MRDIATFAHSAADTLSCEPAPGGFTAALTSPGGTAALSVQDGEARIKVEGSCCVFVLNGDTAERVLDEKCERLGKGCALLMCTHGFCENVYPAEIAIDRIKAADAGDWLELMLLRLIPRSMLEKEFCALTYIA